MKLMTMGKAGWMRGVAGWTGGVVVAAIGFAVPGCDSAAANPSAVSITRAQLSRQLQNGPVRVEVELAADGSVREVHVEDEGPGHETQLAGRVLSIDVAAGTLQLEYLGRVDFGAAQRFRTEGSSGVARGTWTAAVGAAVAGGDDVWLEVHGAFNGTTFVARDVRWEDDAEREIEADITASAYDEAAGTLTIGPFTFQVNTARLFDGSDDSDDRDDDSDDRDDDSDDRDDDGIDSSDDNRTDDAADDNGGDRDDGVSDDADDSTDDHGGDRDDDDQDDDDDGRHGDDD